jgi:hypothetical protein
VLGVLGARAAYLLTAEQLDQVLQFSLRRTGRNSAGVDMTAPPVKLAALLLPVSIAVHLSDLLRRITVCTTSSLTC